MRGAHPKKHLHVSSFTVDRKVHVGKTLPNTSISTLKKKIITASFANGLLFKLFNVYLICARVQSPASFKDQTIQCRTID